MKKRTWLSSILVAVLVLVLSIMPVVAGGARMVEALWLVTEGPNGTGGNSDSEHPHISADGSTIVFQSYATDLIDGFTPNGKRQIYTYDLETEEFELITNGSEGLGANNDSKNPVISGDGTKIAFMSKATDLVATPVAGQNIYIHDTVTGVTTRVNVPPTQGIPDCYYLSMSEDGSTVAYQTMELGDTLFSSAQIVRYDAKTGTSEVISANASGAVGNQHSGTSDISADGKRIVFLSAATNLVDGLDTSQGSYQYYLWEAGKGISCLTLSAPNVASNNTTAWYQPSITADGTRVAFITDATDLTDPAPNRECNVFLWEEGAGISLITEGWDGSGGDDWTAGVCISPDGTKIGVASEATNLIEDEIANGWMNVFLYDLATGDVELITQGAEGIGGNRDSRRPTVLSMGPNGMMTFHSYASDLIDGVNVNAGSQREGSIGQVYIWGRVQLLTVTFDAQNGTTPVSQEVVWGDVVPAVSNPTKAGYTFTGWWTAPSGGSLWDFKNPVTADLTLYAQWVKDVPGLPPTGDGLAFFTLMAPLLFGVSLVSPQLLRRRLDR